MTPPVAFEPLGIRHEGQELVAATLHAAGGMRLRVLNLGGIVWTLHVPDADGALADVVLGYDDPAAYLADRHYLGAICGRFANRIAGARFPLDGAEVRLTANQGPHHLHGGARGFDRVVWAMREVEARGAQGVALTYVSPHGEEGYPGTLETQATYLLHDDGRWEVEFVAETDRPTVVNLTQHSYFNLAGGGSALDHRLLVRADRYLPVDGASIPTGELAPVEGTAFDLRRGRRLGEVVATPGLGPGSLDHSFVLAGPARPGALVPAAELEDPGSGRRLVVRTTEPGVHCYAARYLDAVPGKRGATYRAHDAVCLETQHFPDAPNHPAFPGTVVRPGAPYRARTEFAFSARRPAG